MPIKELSPKDAHEARTANKDAILVDVRSTGEFAQGHPAGALNIPIMNQGPGGMQPNPDFLAIALAVLPKDKKLLVSCLSGGRSMKACQLLEQNGYQDLTNVRCGFGGAKNMMGAITEPGWAAVGLPVESGEPADRAYAALKKKAGK